MGYVFQFKDALHHDDWFGKEPGRSVLAMQKDLLCKLWSPEGTQKVLEVGCGTGLFLEWFLRLGHEVTGIDPSPCMLSMARRRLPSRVVIERGCAEELPFDDSTFDTVALINTLEFVDDQLGALSEAFRVARRHVLIGTINRYSLTTGYYVISRAWKSSLYNHARFTSVLGLNRLVRKAAGGAVLSRWRTCCAMPLRTLCYLRSVECSSVFQRLPFGHFLAMRVDLHPPLMTIQEPLFSGVSNPTGVSVFGSPSWHGTTTGHSIRAHRNDNSSKEQLTGGCRPASFPCRNKTVHQEHVLPT